MLTRIGKADLIATKLPVSPERDMTSRVAELSMIADAAVRRLPSGGTTAVMGDPPTLAAWDLAADWAGLSFMAEITVLWSSPGEAPVRIHRHVKPGHRGPSYGPKLSSNVIVCEPVKPEYWWEPGQLPVELCNLIITLWSSPGDTVVDPFAHVGSFLVAADMNGRAWAGGVETDHLASIVRSRVQRTELEEAYLRPIYTLSSDCKLMRIEG